MAQKAIVVQTAGSNSFLPPINVFGLNAEFAAGWRFISATPFGMTSSHGSGSKEQSVSAAILVILEK